MSPRRLTSIARTGTMRSAFPRSISTKTGGRTFSLPAIARPAFFIAIITTERSPTLRSRPGLRLTRTGASRPAWDRRSPTTTATAIWTFSRRIFPTIRPRYYKNNGDGTFTDATSAAGLGLYTQYLGWGTMFFDIDNDGWPDLLLVNGHVYPEVDSQHLGSSYKEPRILFITTATERSATSPRRRERRLRPLRRRAGWRWEICGTMVGCRR